MAGSCTWELPDGTGECGASDLADGENRCVIHHHQRETLLGEAAQRGRVDLTGMQGIDEPAINDLRSLVTGDLQRKLQLVGPGEAAGSFELDCSGATFIDVVSLAGMTIEHRILCDGTRFEKAVDLSGCTFAAPVSFVNDTSFRGGLTADAARFKAAAGFSRAVFAGGDFSRAVFETFVDFDGTTWVTRETHALAHFVPVAFFFRTAFIGGASFDGADLGAAPNFDGAQFDESVSFAASIDGLRLRHVSMPAQTVFGSSSAGYGHVRLERCIWARPSEMRLDGASAGLTACVVTSPLTITGPAHAKAATSADLYSSGRLTDLVDCTLMAPVTIAGARTGGVNTSARMEGVALDGSTGLDLLRFPYGATWDRTGVCNGRRRVLHNDPVLLETGRRPRGIDDLARAGHPAALESIYRQLRAGLEASKAAPAAADFYYGEMEARRRAAPLWPDRLLLEVYRIFGGYSVRAWRPLTTYAALVVLTALAFTLRTRWFLATPGTMIDGFDVDRSFLDSLAVVARSSVSLFAAPAAGLSAIGALALVVERFVAVGLLALGIVALSSRVRR